MTSKYQWRDVKCRVKKGEIEKAKRHGVNKQLASASAEIETQSNEELFI